MPLWAGYDNLLKGKVADLNNAPTSRFGGAITAALFLEKFVGEGISFTVEIASHFPVSNMQLKN